MITNPKIERKKKDIARTEVKLTEVKGRLREQKQEFVKLENDEIVAMFRSELITEEGYAALMRSRREAENCQRRLKNVKKCRLKNAGKRQK